jgi:acyl carrier protein
MVTHARPKYDKCRVTIIVNRESSEQMLDSDAADMKAPPNWNFRPRVRDAGNQMSTMQASPQERITAAVRRLLADRSITRPFTAQEDLRDVGLTSLDMVNLVLAVESELAVSIPEAEITPANFRSIATIEALVIGLRHKSAA